MTDLATDDRKAVALAMMKRAARDAFKLCAITAEDLAQQIEAGALPIDGAAACRLLAHMFTVSAERE
jgi:hypothetical protein